MELELATDIEYYDMVKSFDQRDCPQHTFIGTGLSSRHIYRIGKNLLEALEDTGYDKWRNQPRIHGRKDDDWIMIWFGEYMVHLFIEQSREDIDLPVKWAYKHTEEEVAEMERIAYGKSKKRVLEPLKKW